MADKFQNKYRIPSARWQNWDYGANAAYFITICTAHRDHFFGEITAARGTDAMHGVSTMQLSPIGEIVNTEWMKTFEMRADMNLEMGEYVIMPNHFHAIIIIGENEYNTAARRDAMHRVSTNNFGPQSKNLASIIRGFKSAVTINARKIHADFAWQTRFHDHVIRNNEEYERIAQYITNNVLNWQTDKFNNINNHD